MKFEDEYKSLRRALDIAFGYNIDKPIAEGSKAHIRLIEIIDRLAEIEKINLEGARR